MSAIELVGRIEIPPTVLKHRFVREAEANAMLRHRKQDVRQQVVGTANTKACELYGWMANVDSHVDNTGFMYAAALNEGLSTIAAVEPGGGWIVSTVEVRQGDVFRLNDHCTHWTEEASYRVAIFVGSWDEPCDAHAVELLRAGVATLARGDYYGAPRVRDGFRALLPDECLVPNEAFTALEPALLADAKAKGLLIEQCGQCGKPAIRPDKNWPYFSDHSRCRDHLGTDDE